MTTRYRTKDGIALHGSTAQEVISSLRDNAWMQSADLETYVRKTAEFAEINSGLPVRGDTAENLLKDLLSVGLIQEVK